MSAVFEVATDAGPGRFHVSPAAEQHALLVLGHGAGGGVTAPDLDDVAARTGLTPAQVIEAHTGTPWRVAFGGFAPGFAYLVGGDPRLEVSRRAEPRTRVPAGAVGLAGEFSGIYPRESPGGWQLIGTTDVVLWDADREPPALDPGEVLADGVDLLDGDSGPQEVTGQ